MNRTFFGYSRPDGSVGIRNGVAILAAMDNSNGVVKKVGNSVKGTIPIPIWYGRGQFGQDEELTFQTLVGIGSNPNFHSVLVISLEKVSANKLANAIKERTKKKVVALAIQDCGNSIDAVAEATKIAAELVSEASEQQKEEFDFSKLVVGVECGGSDTTSGIAGNPSLGYIADMVVGAGGTVILSETSEFLGAEHILQKRARTPEVGQKIIDIVNNVEAEANRRGVSILGANPVPDNIAGGISTIEEKSLGAIVKGGTTEIQDVLTFAEPPQGKGLYIMDTPAPASESMTGISAGGAQIILFSTGKGNIMGSPISPTIKVSGNPETVVKMKPNVDFDVTALFKGEKSLADVGELLADHVVKVCSGKMTTSEILGEEEIALNKIQPTV